MPKFIDLHSKFKPNPLTGDLVTVTDTTAINQSLKNLLMTSAYDRPFRSKQDYSDSIQSLLFEMQSSTAALELKENIFTKIIKHEPRIIVEDVEVKSEQYKLQITIRYKIRTTQEITVFKFFLERI